MSQIDYSSFGAAARAALRLMAVLLSFSVSAALAQDRVDIRFKPGATSTTINGAVLVLLIVKVIRRGKS